MNKTADNIPAGWLEDLAQADSEIEAGIFVTAEEVHRLFDEAKAQRKPKCENLKPEAAARH